MTNTTETDDQSEPKITSANFCTTRFGDFLTI